MAEYSVDDLKRLKAAIEDLEVAFKEWMGTQVEVNTANVREQLRRGRIMLASRRLVQRPCCGHLR